MEANIFSIIKYYINLYSAILVQNLKKKLHYGIDFYYGNIATLIMNITSFSVFWIMFRTIPNLKGWNYYEVMFIYSFSLLALTPTQLLFNNIWNLPYILMNGNFIIYYFRPINIFFSFMCEEFDLRALNQFIFAITIFIYVSIKLKLIWTIESVSLLIVTLFSASLVMTATMVLASAFGFWIDNSIFMLNFVFKFREYSRYPITIYNKLFRFIFTFIIPVGFISFYPSQFFLRPNKINIITWLSPFVGIIFFIISYLVWMKGTRYYSGTGT